MKKLKLILTKKQAKHLLNNIPAGKAIFIRVEDMNTIFGKPTNK